MIKDLIVNLTEGDTRDVVEAISEAFSLFHLTLMPFSELLEKIPFSPIRKLHRSRERLDRIIYRIIETRRQTDQDPERLARVEALDVLRLAKRRHDYERQHEGRNRQAAGHQRGHHAGISTRCV